MASNPFLQPEIGPDGLPREASVIAYTEKVSLSFTLRVYFAVSVVNDKCECDLVLIWLGDRGRAASIEEVSCLPFVVEIVIR